jgi:hypothetical protein
MFLSLPKEGTEIAFTSVHLNEGFAGFHLPPKDGSEVAFNLMTSIKLLKRLHASLCP